MDKWLYHTVVLICIYLIVRKVKQAVTGLDFLAFFLITVTFASRSFPPFDVVFVVSLLLPLQEPWTYEVNTQLALPVIMSVISFQFAVFDFAFPVFFCTEFYFRKLNLSFVPFSCICGFMF